MLSRRDAIRRMTLAMPAVLGANSLFAIPGSPLLKRTIPASGEQLPVIGMGTARTWSVASDDTEHAQAVMNVLKAFHEAGGRVIDVAPHGTVESTLGAALTRLRIQDRVFVAAKVVARQPDQDSRTQGIRLIEQSHKLLGRERFDLLQVGNLFDVAVQLPTILRWRDEERTRYAGITVGSSTQYSDAERLLRANRLEFIQLNYSMDAREAASRLLPFAADTGRAVLVNTPFGNGRLFKAVAGKSLPSWVQEEMGIQSWAQFFLKYVISHPSVTAVLPATRNPKHMADNLGAGFGVLPTEAQRAKMVRVFETL
jgi:aryl-alcohol dehydrogenase-like predicted oxidoreductase